MSETLFQPITPPAGDTAALTGWLVQMAQPGMDLLLAHCDDGVVWGRVVVGKLLQAGDFFPQQTPARLTTRSLQQARLFGPAGELLLWRTAQGLTARLIWQDGQLPPVPAKLCAVRGAAGDDAFAATPRPLEPLPKPEKGGPSPQDEPYLLWGDHALRSAGGFTLLAEGRQGLLHAPPLDALPQGQRAVLLVRHYVAYDADRAYIALSRLTGLESQVVLKRGEQ